MPAMVKLIRIIQNGMGRSSRFSMAFAINAPTTGIVASEHNFKTLLPDRQYNARN